MARDNGAWRVEVGEARQGGQRGPFLAPMSGRVLLVGARAFGRKFRVAGACFW